MKNHGLDRESDFMVSHEKNNTNYTNSLSPMHYQHNQSIDTDSNLMSGQTLKSCGGSQQTLNTT